MNYTLKMFGFIGALDYQLIHDYFVWHYNVARGPTYTRLYSTLSFFLGGPLTCGNTHFIFSLCSSQYHYMYIHESN